MVMTGSGSGLIGSAVGYNVPSGSGGYQPLTAIEVARRDVERARAALADATTRLALLDYPHMGLKPGQARLVGAVVYYRSSGGGDCTAELVS